MKRPSQFASNEFRKTGFTLVRIGRGEPFIGLRGARRRDGIELHSKRLKRTVLKTAKKLCSERWLFREKPCDINADSTPILFEESLERRQFWRRHQGTV